MKPRFTKEQIIERCRSVHGDNYIYEKIDYTTNKEKYEIVCRKHGSFYILINNFLKGVGCRYCANEKKSIKSTKTLNSFLDAAKKKHGLFYNYDKSQYVTARTKLTITCTIHGDFEMTPNDHLSGKGCRLCANNRISKSKLASQEEFISKCVSTHSQRYNYKEVEYVNNAAKVKIICNNCDCIFEQIASLHSGGQGCPYCAVTGFNRQKSGWLYIITYNNLTKIGITNNPVYKRVQDINRTSGKLFTIVNCFSFSNGYELYSTEQELLKQLKTEYQQPSEKFDGYTECFYDVDIEKLIKHIKEQNGTKPYSE